MPVNLVKLNDSEKQASMHYQILSRRSVESMTYLEEEDNYPSYERNEDDAYVSSCVPELSKSLLHDGKKKSKR